MFLAFGLALAWTAVRLVAHRDAEPEAAGDRLARAARRRLPATDAYGGGRLATRAAGGRR